MTQKPSIDSSECLVLGIFSDTELPDFIEKLDKEQTGLVKKLAQKATEPGDAIWQADVVGNSLLIVQCGKKGEFTPILLLKRMNEIVESLLKQRMSSATICLPQVLDKSADWQLEQMILQANNQVYQLLDFKKKSPKAHKLEALNFYLPGASEQTLKLSDAIAEGVQFTRHLANMPANVCTPTYLGNQAAQLAKQYPNLTCKVMEPEEMRKLGMNTILAVAQGSDEPARFVEMQYKGAGDSAPIVLVGKGITFDSGGLSIKPANGMDEMKYDMCGAASVLGTLKACAILQLPINVVGLIACAENMSGGAAVKCGDIINSMSGQTIEIINTDAEGRLVLSDALTYAERFNPEFVIDVATLTGGVIVALGNVASGYMTQDEELAQLLEKASKESQDRIWRLPLDEAYQDAIDSPMADMINAGFDRTASSVTAACFLSRFTGKYRWAHLDIAGTAWISGKKRNATGRPVPLLTQLIRHVANSR
ncbi:MAG: leucyl aminopeptidase [Legionella sp.]|nr:MAG: leucyl aminopeptidase [Legionella sp.]